MFRCCSDFMLDVIEDLMEVAEAMADGSYWDDNDEWGGGDYIIDDPVEG